ncbi:MAG: helix-turn-helix domain-containing protein [Rhodospirillales bacterium]|nr:MAG: helix-turn-helix domain-containing protein [Rhodospirillales bacterium]
MTPDIIEYRFTDVDQMAQPVREAGVVFRQLSAGLFAGGTTRMLFGDLKIHHTWSSPTTFSRVDPDPDSVFFLVPIRWHGELLWNGRPVESPTLIVQAGGDEYTRRATSLNGFTFAVSHHELTGTLAVLGGREPEDVAPRSGILPPELPGFAALRQALSGLASQLRISPRSIEDESFVSAARNRILASCVDVLLAAGGALDEPPPSLPRRLRITRKVEEFALEALPRAVSLAEMCRAAGVSARALQYAFQDLYGMSPLNYVKLRRLGLARKTLLASPGRASPVKWAAIGAGFSELGRFSAEYRALFGERPSETVLRTRQEGV